MPRDKPIPRTSFDTEREFWEWFTANSERLLTSISEDPIKVVGNDPLNQQLVTVHPSLIFELPGEKIDGKVSIVISADGDREAFPAVRSLIAAAPELEDWHLIAFRPRHKDFEFSLQLGDIKLSPQSVHYRSEVDKDRIGIHLFLPGYKADIAQFQMAALALLDAVLGEFDVETEIGFLEMQTLGEDMSELRPLSELRAEIDERKSARH